MKKTKLSLAIAGLVLAGAIIATSCKKSTTTTTTPDTSTTSSTDNNMAQLNAHDITNIGSEAIDNGSLTTYKLAAGQTGGVGIISSVSGIVTINVDSLSYKKITVTF